MKIRIVQSEVGRDPIQNIESALQLARQISTFEIEDIDVLVFPEFFTTGYYQLESIADRAHRLEGSDEETIEQFKELARTANINIVLGSIALMKVASGGDQHTLPVTNTTLIIDRSGEIISVYDKINLFPLFKEDIHLTPGDIVHRFKLDDTDCTSLICYDLRFPELLNQVMSLGGFDLVFIPSQWPGTRHEIFKTLVRARAIENQCFVVFVNAVTNGESNHEDHCRGESLVVDPYGEIVLLADKNSGTFDVEIDLNMVERYRATIPAYQARLEAVRS